MIAAASALREQIHTSYLLIWSLFVGLFESDLWVHQNSPKNIDNAVSGSCVTKLFTSIIQFAPGKPF